MGWKEELKKRIEDIVDSQKDVAKKIASLIEEQYEELTKKAKEEKKELEEIVGEIVDIVTKKMKKEEEKMSMPLLGDKFPTLEVQATHGKMVLPDDLKENGLYFSAILQILHLFVQLSSYLFKNIKKSLMRSTHN